ncbi:MAG: DUF1211 domain-containing protein [Hyphomicrobiales bacterium]|nr:DUF1211 domain-containing protein [Hyphomicrobiales bacterium]
MAEAEGRFSKARLEAFSDGVIAVIITIMVLDLKAPESAEPAALLKLWPSFLIYLVSFVFVAIYWINHHNLLVAARHVTARLIWANNALLFCLSLVPFATAYVADTDMAPFPTMVYGALQFACALAFFLLVSTIAAERRDEGEFMAGFRPRQAQDIAGLGVYALGAALAAFSPIAAIALYVLVALAYVVPGLVADRAQRLKARRRE